MGLTHSQLIMTRLVWPWGWICSPNELGVIVRSRSVPVGFVRLPHFSLSVDKPFPHRYLFAGKTMIPKWSVKHPNFIRIPFRHSRTDKKTAKTMGPARLARSFQHCGIASDGAIWYGIVGKDRCSVQTCTRCAQPPDVSNLISRWQVRAHGYNEVLRSTLKPSTMCYKLKLSNVVCVNIDSPGVHQIDQ